MDAQKDFMPGVQPGPNGPGTRAVPVTPNDGVPLPFVARKLWIGSAGNLTLIPRDSSTPVTFQNVPGGQEFDTCWCRQVLATGTTASAIIALV